jgi:hypothetical protein
MMEIKLETSDGGHLGYSQIAPFNVPPEVLIWGDRVFRFHKEMPMLWIYREAFAVWVTEPVK